MEIRQCANAVRVTDVVIYRQGLDKEELANFIKSKATILPGSETSRGNIYVEADQIILQEWDKYKVKSLGCNFEEKDFTRCGDYGDDGFGTLIFKNCVGKATFKGIKLSIISSKITAEEMDLLIDVVNSYIINLSYDYNQATFSEIDRDLSKKTDLDYHIYLMVHNALKTSELGNNIFSNIRLIENNPCRQMISEIEYENIATVKEISEDALIDIFSGNVELISCVNPHNRLAKKLVNGRNHYLPKEILYEETIDSFDNPENRFIKYFIKWCVNLLEKFQDRFTHQPDFINQELIEYNKKHIGKLKMILNQSFLKNVGEMQNIPMYSTILTRRDGYRQLFHLYLGIKALPTIDSDRDNLEEMIENKSLDVLYENYCFFGMSRLLSEIYGEKLNKKKYRVQKSDFAKTLEKQTDSNFFEFERTGQLPRIRIHYNKNYVSESYSKSFDPDISVEIFNMSDELYAIYVFDSKFKANISNYMEEDEAGDLTEKERKKYKYDDISKMHTYRDALRLAHGAFILYPGTETEIFYENEEVDQDLLYGVGAFVLSPGRESDLSAIKPYVEKLLRKYKTLGC